MIVVVLSCMLVVDVEIMCIFYPGLQGNDHVQAKIDEEALGGMGYTDCFLACVSSLKSEELIKRSPRGKKVSLLLEEIDKQALSKRRSFHMPLLLKIQRTGDRNHSDDIA